MVTLTCENCGTVYQRAKGDEGRGRFCTIKCARAAQPMPSIEETFWKRVRKTDTCWLWTGAHAPQGYGRMRRGRRGQTKQMLAHRVSYELNIGPIPAGKSVCHRCDNPACVNPEHLWLGSRAENNADRDGKGRNAHKLTLDQVHVILAARHQVSAIALAKAFGVSRITIYDIWSNRTWKS